MFSPKWFLLFYINEFYFILFFNFTILYWFSHISTWIHYRYTRVPHPESPPSSQPVPSLWVIPVHQPQASCNLHRTWTGDSFLIWYYIHVLMPFSQIIPSLPLPQSPKDCSIHLCLFCCLQYRVVITIFLNSYICISILYWCFSFCLTSLCIIGSSFIHLIRTDSNTFFLMLSNTPLSTTAFLSIHLLMDI